MGAVHLKRKKKKNSKQFVQVPVLHCISVHHSHHDWRQLDGGNHSVF